MISPIVKLEIQYLHELGRLQDSPTLVMNDLERSIGLTVSSESFEHVVLNAVQQSWTRDPFDRIIVAQVAMESARLVGKDASIRRNCVRAFWGQLATLHCSRQSFSSLSSTR